MASSEELDVNMENDGEKNHQLKATYIGHATVLLDFGGTAILTDPVFSEKIPGRKRQIPPGLTFSALPSVSAVLISHYHYDHFDLPTLFRNWANSLPREI